MDRGLGQWEWEWGGGQVFKSLCSPLPVIEHLVVIVMQVILTTGASESARACVSASEFSVSAAAASEALTSKALLHSGAPMRVFNNNAGNAECRGVTSDEAGGRVASER